jgi:ATP-dependent helicase HepA
MLEQRLIPGRVQDLLDNDTLVDTILPKMISIAKEYAESRKERIISDAMERMNLKLNHEIGRLATLYKKNKEIRPQEIKDALKEQATLGFLISDARVRLDALQLIRADD